MQIIIIPFPEEFKEIQSHEKDNVMYINLLYSATSSELQYTPPTLQ